MDYRLLNYSINTNDNGLNVWEYIYYIEEKMVRSIWHPAYIDSVVDLLVIQKHIMKGNDTKYTPEEYTKIFLNTPIWEKTTYYNIFDNINNNVFICDSHMQIKLSKNAETYNSDADQLLRSIQLQNQNNVQ